MSIFITHGNRLIDFSTPENSDIHIDDIIHHLSMIPRFAGKLDIHYSVLDHSVFVGMIAKTYLKVDDMTGFAALMHDAQEAFLGDIPTPLKALLPNYKKIEQRFELVIQRKFNICMTNVMETLIKTADLLALKSEKQAFFHTLPEHEEHWRFLHNMPLVPVSPCDYCTNSKDIFLQSFNYYTKTLSR